MLILNFLERAMEISNCFRNGIHGIYIGKVHHGCLIAQMFQGCIFEVEMNTLGQQVGCYYDLLVSIVKHGSIITYAHLGAWILMFNIFGQMTDQSKFPQAEISSLG